MHGSQTGLCLQPLRRIITHLLTAYCMRRSSYWSDELDSKNY